MHLDIETKLELKEGIATLVILFNGEPAARRIIELPEGMLEDRYPTATLALGTAEDSPLYTLHDTIEAQINETLSMIEVGLPDAYERAKKSKERQS